MFRDITLKLNPHYQRCKNLIQFSMNQQLFSVKELDADTIFEQLNTAFLPLKRYKLRTHFYTAEQAREHGGKLLTALNLAENAGYQENVPAIFLPDCLSCAKKDCHSAAYYAIHREQELFGLIELKSHNLKKRLANNSELHIYFSGTAAKITYRLSDDLRKFSLSLADQVLNASHEAIIITDLNGTIKRVNQSFCRITGYSEAEVRGKNPNVLQSGKQAPEFYQKLWQQLIDTGAWSGEFINKTKDGKEYAQRGTITTVRNNHGEPIYYAALMEDVSILKSQQESLERLSLYDELTGLPNQNKMRQDFAEFIADSTQQKALAVMLIDLDDFKHINDAVGHKFGDDVLKTVAKRLSNIVTENGIIYRFGGDEFVLITEYDAQETMILASQLGDAFNRQFNIHFKPISVTCSIGIATSNDDNDLDKLLSKADLAMYAAKKNNRGSFVFASDSINADAYEKLQLKTELAHALQNNHLTLVYQPKLSLDDGKTVGLEALVRWDHAELGQISPAKFIPLAERSGQIVDLDYWVLGAVIKQLSKWKAANLPVVPVAINVSIPTFMRPNFVAELSALLDAHDIDSSLLELEVTERVALTDAKKTQNVMLALQKLGLAISIDDFGTGYSSLAYLHTMPITTIKIDRAFIKDIHRNETNQAITGAILAMAKSLNIKTIAEGVETTEEQEYLQSINCDQVQGFLHSKPLPPLDLEQWRLRRETNLIPFRPHSQLG